MPAIRCPICDEHMPPEDDVEDVIRSSVDLERLCSEACSRRYYDTHPETIREREADAALETYKRRNETP